MELEIQKYLRSGKTLEDLQNEFTIKSSPWENKLVNLDYNQIDSPSAHLIVRECRGLILEIGTWDIISMAFRRFFNYGEQLEFTKNFDFTNSFALEKIDGSLCHLFYYEGAWMFSTRSRICNDSELPLSQDITFSDMFWNLTNTKMNMDNLNKNLCYTFEMVSPLNRIITVYKEEDLYLINARDRTDNFKEINYQGLFDISQQINIKLPKAVQFSDINILISSMDHLHTLDEGFVTVNYNKYDETGICFERLKVKNPSYIAIAHIKDSTTSSCNALVRLVIKGEEEEFLSYFSEYRKTVDNIKSKYDSFVEEVKKDIEDIKTFRGSKKDFAMYVKDKKHKDILFKIKNTPNIFTFNDYMEYSISVFGLKRIAKRIMETIGINDGDIQYD